MTDLRHLAVHIERPSEVVYDFARDPRNLPRWAAGLGTAVEEQAGHWFADSPMGRVRVVFADRNPFGVLDHDVTLPDGTTVRNPLRVLADGTDACDVVFTLRQPDGVTDEQLEADAQAVQRDLETLRDLLTA